ncbi:MAG TPA: hypothetical protein VF813_03895, partial [Anaerolineaceae bacterium]
RYLPLYPDDAGEIFNEDFLTRSPNCLPAMLPEFGALSGVVRVIDVASVSGGGTLQVLMNSDLGQAVAVIHPSEKR